MLRGFNEKMLKTGLLFCTANGTLNLLISPINRVSDTMGLLVMITANFYLIQQLHELGQSRRSVARTTNFFSSFFSEPSNEIENYCRDVVDGGAIIVDEVYKAISTIRKK